MPAHRPRPEPPAALAAGEVFVPSPDVVAQRLGSEIVLVHLGTNHVYELNRTGTRLWELLISGLGPLAIHRQMLGEYEVDPAALTQEIEELMAGLLAEQLVLRSSQQARPG